MTTLVTTYVLQVIKGEIPINLVMTKRVKYNVNQEVQDEKKKGKEQ